MPKKDPQSRKWHVVVNNPTEKNIDRDKIKLSLEQLRSAVYWCMAEEIGAETKTHHIHLFIQLRSPARFSRIKKLFPDAHIEQVYGSPQSNKDYVAKTGKWANDPKADTSIPGTFEEWGEIQDELEKYGRSMMAEIYVQIADGMSNAEIMERNPDAAKHIDKMDKIRLAILEARYREEWRELEVIYIFGATGTGKTRGVMEKHGYSDVYRITNYAHPFDRYAQECVILFDEFRSDLPLKHMLVYLEGYPQSLPARYANKQACYETVYIISNIDLKKQYPLLQLEEPESWKAFLRRIHKVIEYKADGTIVDHGSAMEYIFPAEPKWVQEAEQAKEIVQIGFSSIEENDDDCPF